ncbi:hypothetical protein ES705_22615 [subsurface metagenome]
MADIDIGSPAINRAYDMLVGGRTEINNVNPANLDGIIDTVEIWVFTSMTGVMIGTFDKLDGNIFKCRDSVAIGNVASGAKRTFPGLSIEVKAGDYIGIYSATGRIEKDTNLGNQWWFKLGHWIDPGDQNTFGLLTNCYCSLYGSGEEVALGRSQAVIIG